MSASNLDALELPPEPRRDFYALFLMLGMIFGTLLSKAEIISWFRMQEMFRFHSFHMYGVIGSAILMGFVSTRLLQRFQPITLSGDTLQVPRGAKASSPRYWLGGLIFGLGWGLVGACPGPIFALLGHGVGIIAVVLIAALAGTWSYSWLRPYLPH